MSQSPSLTSTSSVVGTEVPRSSNVFCYHVNYRCYLILPTKPSSFGSYDTPVPHYSPSGLLSVPLRRTFSTPTKLRTSDFSSTDPFNFFFKIHPPEHIRLRPSTSSRKTICRKYRTKGIVRKRKWFSLERSRDVTGGMGNNLQIP